MKASSWRGRESIFREGAMPVKAAKNRTIDRDPDPYVIVDFVFDRGLLSISVKNIGTRPAFAVRVEFSHKLMGVEGAEISALPLFRLLEFLPGRKSARSSIAVFPISRASNRRRSPQPFPTRMSRARNSPTPFAIIWRFTDKSATPRGPMSHCSAAKSPLLPPSSHL